MCGIAGLSGDFIPGLMDRMNTAQRHRGPDGQGVFENPASEIALGHVRLAVLDLSESSSQPMHSSDGRYVLVFNGEIYNFRELRQTLESQGVAFRSRGDTEVLLRGLQAEGTAFIKKLDGMFAFALWDQEQQELLISRDRLGVKPLYYAEPVPGAFLFASEIKAMCAHPKLRREPDFFAIQQHLAYGHSSGTRTALRGIQRVPPGGIIRWRPNQPLKTEQYWTPPFCDQPQNFKDAKEQLRELISAAVHRQLVSDVPVGAFLSGGLDSSLIARLASEQGVLNCYTTTYSSADNQLDQSASDLPYARFMAKELGARLEEIAMTSDVASIWQRLIYHLDEPLADPAAIACYLISRLAKEDNTTVMLSGQGADELLAGYPRYWAIQSTQQIDSLPMAMRSAITRMASVIPGALPGRIGGTLRRVRRVLSEAQRTPIERFLGYCSATPSASIRSILSPDFLAAIGDETALDECARGIRNDPSAQNINRFLRRDLGTYLPNHNLLYTDKMGMATGIETRVPFIDNALVDFIVGLPPELKIQKGTTKFLLKEAARTLVPDRVIDRRKAGFGAPYRSWLRNDLSEMWNDLTDSESVNRRGWFDPQALAEIRHQSQTGKTDLYMLQWAVLTMELWARQFIDQNPADQN